MGERQLSRSTLLNRIDPVYIFLDRIVFNSLFALSKSGDEGSDGLDRADGAESEILLRNMVKHRWVLWINILLVCFLSSYGLDYISKEYKELIISGLLAPAMITGAAWYAVSFGGFGEKYVSIAFRLTFLMFLSFTLSMTLLTTLLVSITPVVGMAVVVPIYLSLYFASVLYDSLDGLKMGLDTTLLRYLRAALNYYQKYGLVTKGETQKEVQYNESTFTSEEIARYTYLTSLLDSNINKLESKLNLRAPLKTPDFSFHLLA